jgi:hypothetical protein
MTTLTFVADYIAGTWTTATELGHLHQPRDH